MQSARTCQLVWKWLLVVFYLSSGWAFSQGKDGFSVESSGEIQVMAVQLNGKVLLGGFFSSIGGHSRAGLARFNADGTFDETFDTHTNFLTTAMFLGVDGRIIVGFYTFSTSKYGLISLNSDGLPNGHVSLAANGEILALAVQADGKIVVGGSFTSLGGQSRSHIARVNVDGSLDTGFNPGVTGSANPSPSVVSCLAVQPDGKILVTGNFTTLASSGRQNIGRLNNNGTLDLGFTGRVDFQPDCILLQSDGKLIVGADIRTLSNLTVTNIGRLNTNGTADASFNPGATNMGVRTLSLQADGKILVGGAFNGIGGGKRTAVARIYPDGTLDASFNAHIIPPATNPGVPSMQHEVRAMAIQPDGRLLLAGSLTNTDSMFRAGSFMRFTNTEPAVEDLQYDGSVVLWLRGGTGPEVLATTFEKSTDGANWIALGSGLRVSGGWQYATGPLPENSLIRVRGLVSGGTSEASIWVLQKAIQIGPANPILIPRSGGFDLVTKRFGFDVIGNPGATVVVEGSVDFLNWVPLVTNILGVVPMDFVDPQSTNFPAMFCRARMQ
jgi:uncharacterized delta-60 repeat protein